MKRLRVIVLTAFVALLLFWGLNAAPEFTINGSILTAVELNGDSEIIIPDGVTVIMDYAFRNCYNLTSLIIPTSVTGIGGAAFYGCCNLSHITFMGDKLSLGSENLGYIAQNCVIESNGHYNGTYYDSSSNVRWTINDGHLTHVELNGETRITIPSVVTSIGTAFQSCWELKSVTIPASVTTIVNAAFDGCRNLESIEFKGNAPACNSLFYHDVPDGCEVVVSRDSTGWGVGEGELWRGLVLRYASNVEWIINDFGDLLDVNLNGENDIRVPNGVARIMPQAFGGCNELTSVVIPSSVTRIESDAFADCHNLTNVTIGSGVETIYNNAFYNCDRLTSVTIRGGTTRVRVEDDAFNGCTALTNITVGVGVTRIADFGFQDSRGLTVVTIADSVTEIGYRAFADCSGLTNVSIGNGVARIGSYAFLNCSGLTGMTIPVGVDHMEAGAFAGCSGLTNITVDADNANYMSVDGLLLSKDGATLILCANQSERISIPDDVKTIGNSAFENCRGLKNVLIPDGVVSIDDFAFYGCSSLTQVTIPDSVTNIGNQAFHGCSGLADASGFVVIRNVLYSYHGADDDIAIPDGVTRIGNYAFNNCGSITSVAIPDGITDIESYAFRSCSGLTNIIVETGSVNYSSANGLLLSKDGTTLIQGVNGDVTIPDGVTNIAAAAFFDCCDLASVSIPDSVTAIGDSAFYGCSRLRNITVPECVCTKRMSSVFPSAYFSITNVVVSDNVTSIGNRAFCDCNGLSNVSIGNGVTNIGAYAFYYCRGLTSVAIPINVASVGTSAFSQCAKLSLALLPIHLKGSVSQNNQFKNCASNLQILFYDGDVDHVCIAVHLDANGGTVDADEISTTAGAFTNALPMAMRDGYSFAGWWTSPVGGEQFYQGMTLERNTIAYAHWTGKEYTVNLHANGGMCDVASTKVVYGEQIGCLPSATRDGFAFMGWFSEPEGGVLISQTSQATMLEDTTYYAHWTCDWNYVVKPDGTVEITGHNIDMGGMVVLPSSIDGRIVTSIGDYAFQNCSSMESVIIPKGVVSIGQKAFAGSSLHSVFFKGNRPSVGTGIFDEIAELPTVHVSRTAAGWDGYLSDSWQGCVVTFVRPYSAFNNTFVFRTGIDVFEVVTNICAIEQQPIVGDLIGVQTEVYIDSGLEDDLSEVVDTNSISVYMAYCLEVSKWGMDSWCKNVDWHKLTKVETNYAAAGNFFCFRSSPSKLTSYIPPQTSPTVVQYALMVVYRDLFDGWTTNLISAADWCRPMWYGSCDLNAVNGQTLFAPYTIIESVAPGDVWINEVNIYDGYDSGGYYNLARTNQFIEIAAPIFADLTGWRINYIGESRNGFSTNTIYTFQGYESSAYPVTSSVNAMVFPTIQSPMSSVSSAAGKWRSGVFESDTINEYSPFALQLVSPLGVPIHSIVLRGTNIWAFVDRYSPENLCATLNQTQSCDSFILAGEDAGLGSLSVVSNTGRLSSDWQSGCALTPGMPNAGQAVKSTVSVASSIASIFYPDEPTSETLKEKLTTVADYNAFGEWAWNVVVHGNGIWISDVKSNDRSWLSFALGADTVITNDIARDDVKIESFVPSSTDGKFEFTVSVKDVNIGGGSVAESVLKENLKKVLGIEGAKSLSSGAFSSDNIDITFDTPVDGKAKFTVSPPADAGNSFFMRVKVK